MISEFSEFSYGYALTENIVSRLGRNLISAPFFPSLREEGNENNLESGFDLKLESTSGVLYFLQFKLSDEMVRATCDEIKNHNLPLLLPFLRFFLMPLKTSPQHDLLLRLNNSFEHVYYVAPRFNKQENLNTFYLSQTLSDNSAFLTPLEIGSLPDNDIHHIAFEHNANFGYRLSKEEIKVNFKSADIFKNLPNITEKSKSLKEQITNLFELFKYSINFDSSISDFELLKNLSKLSLLHLNAACFVVKS